MVTTNPYMVGNIEGNVKMKLRFGHLFYLTLFLCIYSPCAPTTFKKHILILYLHICNDALIDYYKHCGLFDCFEIKNIYNL
jgi:hypothetical protein